MIQVRVLLVADWTMTSAAIARMLERQQIHILKISHLLGMDIARTSYQPDLVVADMLCIKRDGLQAVCCEFLPYDIPVLGINSQGYFHWRIDPLSTIKPYMHNLEVLEYGESFSSVIDHIEIMLTERYDDLAWFNGADDH